MRRLSIAAVVAVAALTVSSTGHAAAGHATLKTRHGGLGTFLVDGRGHTLYLFQKDARNKSKCSGACATGWPPLLTSGRAMTSGSVRKSLLGTTKRSDGRTQVTYNGHPLYLYSGDAKAGDTNGQRLRAFGARWYEVSVAGKRLGGGY